MDRVTWTPYKPNAALNMRQYPLRPSERTSASENTLVLSPTPRFSGGASMWLRGAGLLLLAGVMALPVACRGTLRPTQEHKHSHGQAKNPSAATWEGYMALSDQLHHAVEEKHDVVQTETTLNQALKQRLFPELKSLFLSSYARPDNSNKREIVIGEFTHPSWDDGGMDGGRGLRIAFRRTNNDNRRTSAILFVDYNPTTQQFEWVNQKAGSQSPDVIRFLHETEPLRSDPQRGFMGQSYTGKFDSKGQLAQLMPTPYYTALAEPRDAYPVATRKLPDELMPAHCIMCHGRQKSEQFFRITFEQQRVAPGVAHAKSVNDFDAYLASRAVPIPQRQQVRQWLNDPMQHWKKLVPKDFLDDLMRLD